MTRNNIKMILLLITLLLFHQGYTLLPVTTVQLGDPVTFTCFFPDSEYSNTRVKWYKQSIGDTLQVVTILMKATVNPTFEQGFDPSRFEANSTTTMSTLTILKTIQEDKALYHCGVTTWSGDKWSGMYLAFKGNTERTTDYTIVQKPTVFDPVHLGDSVTLQCSVLSESKKNKSCLGERSVHWFGVKSDKSYPNIVYTGGNNGECDEKPGVHSPPKSCVYSFSKNVSSSDAGTYYCAVATCGEIIFGNGTKLDIEGSHSLSVEFLLTDNIILLLLCAALAISVMVIACLIYIIMKNKCHYCDNKAAVSLPENVARRNLKRGKDTWIYSVVIFTMMKTGSGGMRGSENVDRERIYAAVKDLGMD